MKKYEVAYSAGPSQHGNEPVDFMMVEVGGVELYAEMANDTWDAEKEAFQDETATYDLLREEILEQAKENGIPEEALSFQYDDQYDEGKNKKEGKEMKVLYKATVGGHKFAIIGDETSKLAYEAVWSDRLQDWETDFSYEAIGVDSFDVAGALNFETEKQGYIFHDKDDPLIDEVISFVENFPINGEAYQVGKAGGRYFFTWGPDYPYSDEMPKEEILDGGSGIQWFGTQEEAETAMKEAVDASGRKGGINMSKLEKVIFAIHGNSRGGRNIFHYSYFKDGFLNYIKEYNLEETIENLERYLLEELDFFQVNIETY